MGRGLNHTFTMAKPQVYEYNGTALQIFHRDFYNEELFSTDCLSKRRCRQALDSSSQLCSRAIGTAKWLVSDTKREKPALGQATWLACISPINTIIVLFLAYIVKYDYLCTKYLIHGKHIYSNLHTRHFCRSRQGESASRRMAGQSFPLYHWCVQKSQTLRLRHQWNG